MMVRFHFFFLCCIVPILIALRTGNNQASHLGRGKHPSHPVHKAHKHKKSYSRNDSLKDHPVESEWLSDVLTLLETVPADKLEVLENDPIFNGKYHAKKGLKKAGLAQLQTSKSQPEAAAEETMEDVDAEKGKVKTIEDEINGDSRLQSCEEDPESVNCQVGRAHAMARLHFDLERMKKNIVTTNSSVDLVELLLEADTPRIEDLYNGLSGENDDDLAFPVGIINALGLLSEAAEQGKKDEAGAVAHAETEEDRISTSLTENTNQLLHRTEEYINSIKDDVTKLAKKITNQASIAFNNIGTYSQNQVTTIAETATQNEKTTEEEITAQGRALGTSKNYFGDMLRTLDDNSKYELSQVRDVDKGINHNLKGSQSAGNSKAKTDMAVGETEALTMLLTQVQRAQDRVKTTAEDQMSTIAQDITRVDQVQNQNQKITEDKVNSFAESVHDIAHDYSQSTQKAESQVNGIIHTDTAELENFKQDEDAASKDTTEMVTTLSSSEDAVHKNTADVAKNTKAVISSGLAGVEAELKSDEESLGESITESSTKYADKIHSMSESFDDSVNGLLEKGKHSLSQAATASGSTTVSAGTELRSEEGLIEAGNDGLHKDIDVSLEGLNAKTMLSQDVLGNELNEAAKTELEVQEDSQDKILGVQDESRKLMGETGREIAAKMGTASKNAVIAGYYASTTQTEEQEALDKDFAMFAEVMNSLEGGSAAVNLDVNNVKAALHQMTEEQQTEFKELMNQLRIAEELGESESSQAAAKVKSFVSNALGVAEADLHEHLGEFTEDFSHSVSNVVAENSNIMNTLMGPKADAAVKSEEEQALGTSLATSIDSMNAKTKSEFESLATLLLSLVEESEQHLSTVMFDMDNHAIEARKQFSDEFGAQLVAATNEMIASAETVFSQHQHSMESKIDEFADLNLSMQELESEAKGAEGESKIEADEMDGDMEEARESVEAMKEAEAEELTEVDSEVSAWDAKSQIDVGNALQQSREELYEIPEQLQSMTIDSAVNISKESTQLEEYLWRFEKAFEASRTVEADYLRGQAVRRLSAMLNVSHLSIENRAKMIAELSGNSGSESERARALATVLNGLSDALENIKGSDDKTLSLLATELEGMENNDGMLSEWLKSTVDSSLEGSSTEMHDEELNNDLKLNGQSLESEGLVGALGGQVENIIGDMKEKEAEMDVGLSKSSSSLFALNNLLHSVDGDVKLALQEMMRDVENGETTVEELLSSNREVSTERLNTVEDVVKTFVTVMESHVAANKMIYNEMKSDLTGFEEYAKTKLEGADGTLEKLSEDMDSGLGLLKEKEEFLTENVAKYTTKASENVEKINEEIVADENAHQTEMDSLKDEVDSKINEAKHHSDETEKEMDEGKKEMEKKVETLMADVQTAFVVQQGKAPPMPQGSGGDEPLAAAAVAVPFDNVINRTGSVIPLPIPVPPLPLITGSTPYPSLDEAISEAAGEHSTEEEQYMEPPSPEAETPSATSASNENEEPAAASPAAQAPSEAPAEAPTEPPTEPATEPPTEVPTEPPTEAPASMELEEPEAAESPSPEEEESPSTTSFEEQRPADAPSFI